MDLIIHQLNRKLLDGVDISSTQTSDEQEIQKFSLYSIQFKWTGFTGTATIYIECTNDQLTESNRVWTPVDTYGMSGSTGNRMVNVEKAAYGYVRVRIVPSTATGSVTATMNAKVL